MAEVFSRQETVFFVGGPRSGTQAGLVTAGGCTKDFFDTNGGEDSFDLLDIMGPNGEAKDSGTGATITAPSGPTTTLTKVGGFSNTVAGMVAYLSGTGANDGRYEILSVISDDQVIVTDDTYLAPGTGVSFVVGGAFDSINSVDGNVDADDSSGANNVDVYINKDVLMSGFADNISISAGGGNIQLNTFLRYIGFNSIPNDMMPGGDFYCV
jgi:hypothetical protein